MKKIILVLVSFLAAHLLLAQGCSDAGFCSLSALKEVNQTALAKNRIDFGGNFGLGEEKTTTLNPYLQYERMINNRLSVLGKVTSAYASGVLGSSFSVGDFFAVATYKANKQEETPHEFRLLGGIKIPFTSSNQKNSKSFALPLDYQASLGTYDVIVGVNYIYKKHWEVNVGYQLPVIQQNKNTFFSDDYSDSRVKGFVTTNGFKRKPDALLRGGYYFNLTKKFLLKPTLLAIVHQGQDSYETRIGTRENISGSSGLTLNGTLSATKIFKNGSRLEIIGGTPFIARDVRPDGLTRKLVLNVQYSILFN